STSPSSRTAATRWALSPSPFLRHVSTSTAPLLSVFDHEQDTKRGVVALQFNAPSSDVGGCRDPRLGGLLVRGRGSARPLAARLACTRTGTGGGIRVVCRPRGRHRLRGVLPGGAR